MWTKYSFPFATWHPYFGFDSQPAPKIYQPCAFWGATFGSPPADNSARLRLGARVYTSHKRACSWGTVCVKVNFAVSLWIRCLSIRASGWSRKGISLKRDYERTTRWLLGIETNLFSCRLSNSFFFCSVVTVNVCTAWNISKIISIESISHYVYTEENTSTALNLISNI